MIYPQKTQYDYGLGIEPDILSYIRESHVVESRISSTRCYLYQQKLSGSVVGSAVSPVTITTYYETDPQYKSIIWASGSVHPDSRAYVQQGAGALRIIFNGTEGVRVLAIDDLVNDNEYAVVTRWDLTPPRIEAVFNPGFNAGGATLQYYFTTINQGIVNEMLKRGDSVDQSLYGWTQYRTTYRDAYQDRNQVLVRLPLTVENLVIKEEGKILLQENDSWTLWDPYIREFDLIIIPGALLATGVSEWYEVQEKRDSYIQQTLMSQRFKLKLLEASDPRTRLTIVTT